MRKLIVFAGIGALVFLFSYCSSSKKASSKTTLLTYDANLVLIINEKCTPCHIPDKGGRMKPLNTYEAVRADIDEIVRRISLSPEENGYMPFKNAKLSDSTIAIFKQWKEDGQRER
jgi:hypothetical protein